MNVGFAAEATSVLSPSLVLSSRVGFIRHDFYIAARTATASTRRRSGFPVELRRRRLRARSFPQIQLRRLHRRSAARSAATTAASSRSATPGRGRKSLSKTTGNHSFKIGGELRALVNDQQNPTSSFGRLQRSIAASLSAIRSPPTRRRATRWPRCCSAIRSTAPRRRHRASRRSIPRLNYRGNYVGLFVQDDWRVSSRLTLNAGLRWDYESPIVEELNQQNIGFDTTSHQPVPGAGPDAARRAAVCQRRPAPAVQDAI